MYSEAMDQGRRFDLVISDLTIPGGMGGRDAVKRLRELDPQVKAIVSSGYATDPVMSAYRDHGFCGMIAKPYEIEALGAVVADVLATPTPVPSRL
jgi:DNA-binding NtrC family response regulator